MKLRPLALAITSIFATSSIYAEELEAIKVTADLRTTAQQDIAASVDIKTQADLQDQGATHFDDVLLKTPNVNYSGQSSRARYIQIRGIGEREEYTGAPNSSIGFAIDDIDFSGIGMAGGLFDVKQVEVLRGPQNIRYGQSAIGGLINIQSNDPTPYEEGMAELSLGQDNLQELGIVTSGPISKKERAPQYRLSILKHGSDGFRNNKTLGETDTNGRDELTVRGKMRFFPSSKTTIDLTAIHANLDNNYDAWAEDNSYNTLSNNPGKDRLLTNALGLKIESDFNPNFTLSSKTSAAKSDLLYSFDGDWGPIDGGFDIENQKDRKTASQELRLASTPESKLFGNTDWLVGLYGSHLNEQNTKIDTSKTDYTQNKFAGLGQLDLQANDKTLITTSFRIERSNSTFENSTDRFNPTETLWGASLGYSYKYNANHTAYTSVTRGYKTGGFNADLVGTSDVSFNKETLYNYEIGLKSNLPEHGLKTDITLFYMDRKSPQFEGSEQLPNGHWQFYTENLDSAQNYGLEASANWSVNNHWSVYGSAGLIKTNVKGEAISGNQYITSQDQPHAPNYQINLGAQYRSTNGFYAQADVTAVDSFYFDNIHAFKSETYQLINARIGYETHDYEVYLWAKNITDERYATRGYSFDMNMDGNDQDFVRLGDPRQLGITARVYF